jgi:Zn-dependent protease with chaperone function
LISVLVLIYLTARTGTWLAAAAARWPLRRSLQAHWTERARMAWPSRRIGLAVSALAGGFSMAPFLLLRSEHPLLPKFVLIVLAVSAAILGTITSTIANERRVNPAYVNTPRATRGAWIFRVAILGPILLIVIAATVLLPDQVDATAMIILALVVIGTGSYLAWGWVALMRWLGVFRPASERLDTIVSRLAEEAGVAVRGTEQVALPMANAFALPLDGKLAMTDAALSALDDDEVRVICAHELAHLAEPRRFLFVRLLRGFVLGLFLALVMAAGRPLTGAYGLQGTLAGLVSAFLILIVSVRLLNWFSRKMEHRADAQAVHWEPSAGLYARALEKIYEANLVPAVLRSKRMTHPDLFDRMVLSGVTPDYPRPAPPPRWPGFLGLAALVVSVVVGVMAYRLLTDSLPNMLFDPASAAIWKIGAGSPDGLP